LRWWTDTVIVTYDLYFVVTIQLPRVRNRLMLEKRKGCRRVKHSISMYSTRESQKSQKDVAQNEPQDVQSQQVRMASTLSGKCAKAPRAGFGADYFAAGL
jgi:hypothetical protein